MAIVRLRHVSDQAMTSCTDPHTSTLTLYTFLKSSASTADRAIAMREFHRHASRYEERGGGALLHRNNATMVMLCEEAVHDVLLRSQVVSSTRNGGSAAKSMMQERNPTLALERNFWRHFLTHPAARASSLEHHRHTSLSASPKSVEEGTTTRRAAVHHSNDSASTYHQSSAADTAELSHETVRVKTTRPAHHYDDDDDAYEAMLQRGDKATAVVDSNDDDTDDATTTSFPQTRSPPPQLMATQRPTSVPAVSHQRSPSSQQQQQPSALRVDPLPANLSGSPQHVAADTHAQPTAATVYGSPPLVQRSSQLSLKELPQEISSTLRDVLDRFRSEATSFHPKDAEQESQSSRIHNRIAALRTRLQAQMQASSSSAPRSAFLQQLSDRVHNAEAAHLVHEHEQDTLDLTANALRVENAALTKTLRVLLAIMTAAEVQLSDAAPGQLPRHDVILLSALQDVLDEATNTSVA
ncbi:Hypothetical protein, putative [Bodo saltans]|uniref:Uncharacterized protein n=1 Tax=Bodo saltans TaxID=75058 RepID=A0A0S4JNK6_BODSA|nr:Hypothetical protein, putative [Bodo saltans]|eukprot:CUG91728.1 Hypothetical protein, putative [Bodo saltans]